MEHFLRYIQCKNTYVEMLQNLKKGIVNNDENKELLETITREIEK